MKSEKVKYTDDKGQMAGELVRIKDFLPPPDEPVESVTVTLHGDVLAFFQREANQRNASYQQIIRSLVRSYARGAVPIAPFFRQIRARRSASFLGRFAVLT